MGKVSGFFLKTLTPGVLAGSLIAVKYAKDARQSKERIRRDYLLYAEWLKMKQKGESPGAYLRQNGWRRVAIYGMGAVGIRAATQVEFKAAFAEALTLNRPVVIDCQIDCDDKVWPMVAPGKAISEVFDEKDLEESK